MVLIESLSCGTPVVSYNCPTGPNEIIQHEKNGLLVKANDKQKMTNAMNRMVEDKGLYNKLSANAKNSRPHSNGKTTRSLRLIFSMTHMTIS